MTKDEKRFNWVYSSERAYFIARASRTIIVSTSCHSCPISNLMKIQKVKVVNEWNRFPISIRRVANSYNICSGAISVSFGYDLHSRNWRSL